MNLSLNLKSQRKTRPPPLIRTRLSTKNSSRPRTNKCLRKTKSNPRTHPSPNSTTQRVVTRNWMQSKNSSQSLISDSIRTSNPKAFTACKKPRKRKWPKPCATTANCKKRIPWTSASNRRPSRNPTSTSTRTTPLRSNPPSPRNSKCRCSRTTRWTWACSSSARRWTRRWSRGCTRTSNPWACPRSSNPSRTCTTWWAWAWTWAACRVVAWTCSTCRATTSTRPEATGVTSSTARPTPITTGRTGPRSSTRLRIHPSRWIFRVRMNSKSMKRWWFTMQLKCRRRRRRKKRKSGIETLSLWTKTRKRKWL